MSSRLSVALALGLCPSLALASAPAPAATATARLAPPPSLEDAQRLHREGQDRYDTADYQGAIERWTEAYGALPSTPKGAAMKPFVLYNIASAHEKAFEIYGDVAQLKQARTLLAKFEATVDEIYEDPSEAQAERARVNERIAAIDALIAEHDQRRDGSDPEPGPAPDEPPPDDDPAASPAASPGPLPPDDASPPRRPDPRLVSGAVLVGLGAGAGALLLAGVGLGVDANDISGIPSSDLDERERQFDRGRSANAMAIAGAVATPLLLGVGIALIVLAKRKPRTSRGAAMLRAPVAGAPAGFSLRF